MSGNKQENKAYYGFCKVLNDRIREDGVRRQSCLLTEGVTEVPEDTSRSTSAQTLGSVSTHDTCCNACQAMGQEERAGQPTRVARNVEVQGPCA